MKRFIVLGCLLLLFFFVGLPARVRASSLQAKVVEIIDGDTMVVINVNRRIRVALKGSDAPEERQRFGDVARQHLSDLILDQEVLVDYTELGQGGSLLVAKVFRGQMDVGQQMIRDGVAWYDRRYERDLSELERRLYEESEAAARGEHRGLWQDASPVAPWTYRLAQNSGQAQQGAAQTATANSTAGPTIRGRVAGGLRSGEMGSVKRMRWQRVAPAGEYFSVLMPDEGQQYTSKIPPPPGKRMEIELSIVNYNGVIYMVHWMTFVDRAHPSVDRMFEQSIAGFQESLRQLVKRYGPGFACEVSYDKDISLGGVPGRQYSVSKCSVPGVVRIYYKVSGSQVKMYVATTMLGLEGNPVVDRFFDSFRISKERNSGSADERPTLAGESIGG